MTGAVLLHPACRDNDKAGRAARAVELCTDYCRLAVRASDPSQSGECHRGCIGRFNEGGPACESAWIEWLACEGRSGPTTQLPAEICAGSWHKAAQCSRECRQAGIVVAGETRLSSDITSHASYELHLHGCTPCVPEPGAAASAPCSAAKVCASRCFECASKRSSASLRACVDGRCAGAAEISALMAELDALTSCRARP